MNIKFAYEVHIFRIDHCIGWYFRVTRFFIAINLSQFTKSRSLQFTNAQLPKKKLQTWDHDFPWPRSTRAHVPVHFVGNQPDNLGERLYMKPNRVPGLPGLRQQ